MRKYLKHGMVLIFSLSLCACGLAGQEDECENPHPSQKAECEAKESSDWNKMNWNEGTWG